MAMLSGAVAGVLRVGAVALTAGGLATGIYFAVQVGRDEDSESAQAPAATSTALSPPNQVVARPTAQPTITPTYILAPSPTPPTGVDTSNWKTYTGAEGFSFKYPPDWTLETEPRLRVISPEAARTYAEPGEARRPGMAEFTAFLEAADGFPVNVIIANCERRDPLSSPGDLPTSAAVVTFLGRRTVRCQGSAVDDTTRAQTFGISYSVDFSLEQMLRLGGYVVPQGGVSFATLEAIAASFSLGATQ